MSYACTTALARIYADTPEVSMNNVRVPARRCDGIVLRCCSLQLLCQLQHFILAGIATAWLSGKQVLFLPPCSLPCVEIAWSTKVAQPDCLRPDRMQLCQGTCTFSKLCMDTQTLRRPCLC
jgi:hypothetical protein